MTFFRNLFPRAFYVNLGWATFTYGAVQVLRLINNVVLSRLLTPPLFGMMLIVNTIRTGVELLSDVGISQNIIRHRRGDDPVFYDTAWTVQAIRGVLLGTACFFSAKLVAQLFDSPGLAQILPVVSLFFVFQGLDSVSRSLLQKGLAVDKLSKFELISAALSVAIHIILALISPTIWALILGSIFTGAVSLIGTYMLMPGLRHRFIIDRPNLRELLQFGRWIFVSSLIYFVAMNFDRLYFARHITLTQLGIFGIARTLSDMLSVFVTHASSLILFPMVAAMRGSAADIRGKLLRGRRLLLLATAIGLAGFTAVSDRVVGILYDPRYAEAGLLLPVLALGTWFAILSSINDSIMIGLGHSKISAAGNFAKLVSYIIGVPLALAWRGLDAAIIVLSAGEMVRYLTLWVASRREGLGFARNDAVLTIVLLAGVVLFRLAFQALGLTSGIEGLFPFIFSLLGTA